MAEQNQTKPKFRTSIGGQALIEGILMRGPEKQAIVVRSPEGELSIDLCGRVQGRGAYLCRSSECLKRAVKSRALERALSVPVPEDVWARLTAELEAGDG